VTFSEADFAPPHFSAASFITKLSRSVANADDDDEFVPKKCRKMSQKRPENDVNRPIWRINYRIITLSFFSPSSLACFFCGFARCFYYF
jgi:hypothetical protein